MFLPCFIVDSAFSTFTLPLWTFSSLYDFTYPTHARLISCITLWNLHIWVFLSSLLLLREIRVTLIPLTNKFSTYFLHKIFFQNSKLFFKTQNFFFQNFELFFQNSKLLRYPGGRNPRGNNLSPSVLYGPAPGPLLSPSYGPSSGSGYTQFPPPVGINRPYILPKKIL